MNQSIRHVIEFRNGSYFQGLDADHGGSLETAQDFDTAEQAMAFANEHPWIWGNGGMVVEVSRCTRKPPYDASRPLNAAQRRRANDADSAKASAERRLDDDIAGKPTALVRVR